MCIDTNTCILCAHICRYAKAVYIAYILYIQYLKYYNFKENSLSGAAVSVIFAEWKAIDTVKM